MVGCGWQAPRPLSFVVGRAGAGASQPPGQLRPAGGGGSFTDRGAWKKVLARIG